MLIFLKIMKNTFFLLSALFLSFLFGCKTATDSTSNGSTSGGDIKFTEQLGLPMTGGNITGIGLLADQSMVALIDDKLYTISASGSTPTLINGDMMHIQLALAPDGSVYTVLYDQSKDSYSMRRYDLPSGAFTSLQFPAGTHFGGGAIFKFSKNGEVFICYPDRLSVNSDMYYSTDKGATWTNLKHLYGQIDVAFTPSGDILSVASSPSSCDLVKSSDHGANWITVSSYSVNALGRNLFCRANGDIFTYDDGGNIFHVSHDAGKTLTRITWGADKPFTHQLAESGGAVYLMGGHSAGKTSNQFGGVLRSDDGGITWKNIFLCATGSSMSMNGNAIALGSSRGIFYTADTKEWTQTGNATVAKLSDIALDKDGNILLTADATLYRKIGNKWTVLASPSGAGILHRSRNGNLLCSGGTSVIYSSDNGASWQWSTTELKAIYQWDVAIRGFASNSLGDIYAGVAEYDNNIPDYVAGELLRSTDGGASFTSIFSQNNFTSIFAAGTDLIGADQFFVGKHVSEALFSSDMGKTWSAYAAKYPLCMNNQNNYISLRSSTTELDFDFTTYSTKASKELKSNIVQDGHTFITSAKFGSDNRLYVLTTSLAKGNSIYVSDQPVE